MNTYKAPWSTSLVAMSALVTVVWLVIATAMALSGPPIPAIARIAPAAVLPLALLFVVRGYTITSTHLEIERLLWTTRFPLNELHAAEVQPDAMTGSWRTFGNGGLFSFTGFYHSKELGTYRAFVTDLHPTVVLRFAKRTVIVSPERPEEFAREIATKSGANLFT